MFKEHKHYSSDIENAIIGACMLEASAFPRVYDNLKPDAFYLDENKIVFSALVEMFEGNAPINLLSVVDYLARIKGVKNINGSKVAYLLTQKITKVVSTANLEYEANCLMEMYLDREIIKLTLGGPAEPDLNPRDHIKLLQDRLNQLNQKTTLTDWVDMSELMVSLYRHQDEMLKSGGVGLLTGFRTLDRVYGGFHPGQMIVIAARPSVGKSALSGQISLNMAIKGIRVGIISLEMNNVEIAARLASIDTSCDFNTIFRALYQDERQKEAFNNRVSKHTSTLPVWVSDKTDVSITDIKAKAYKLKVKHGLDCLILDYLQLVGGDGRRSSREEVVSSISRGCKIIAKELNVPLIVLAQLNREVEKRKGKDRYPVLSDLRESGSIEQDADVVMFLHSDFRAGVTEDEQGNSTEGQADLIVRKWRNAQSNLIIKMDFNGAQMKFSEREDNGLKPVRMNNYYEVEKDESAPF